MQGGEEMQVAGFLKACHQSQITPGVNQMVH